MTAPVAANIRPAASVIVLRDGPRGVEVLLMRRPERDNDFRSGACVFPGGVLDRGDADAHALCLGQDDAQASLRLGLAGGGQDYFVAALRECFEEVGLLYACQADGTPIDVAAHAEALQQWRHRLHRGEATLPQMLQAFGWRLDLREMAYFSHWLTPVVRPKRFDTRFFVRLAPTDQQAVPDLGEALELMWLTPDEALDPARRLKLLNVTQRTLHELRGFASAQAAFDVTLAKRGVQRILPRPVRSADGRERFVIPGMPAYDEVEALDPEGRGDVPAEITAGEITRLSPRLRRIAGVKRHAYLVTDLGGNEAAVIDADAEDAEQWHVLCNAAPAAVRWLLASGPLPPPAAVQAHWPAARAAAAGTCQDELRLGIDTRLHTIAIGGQCVLRLAEDDIVLGGEAALAGAAHAARWFAGARGFLTRLGRP